MEQNDERRTYLGRVGDVTRRFRTARLVHARPDPVVMSMTVIVVVIIAIAVIVDDDPRPADAAPSTARIERVDQLPPLGIVFPEASMAYRRYQFRHIQAHICIAVEKCCVRLCAHRYGQDTGDPQK